MKPLLMEKSRLKVFSSLWVKSIFLTKTAKFHQETLTALNRQKIKEIQKDLSSVLNTHVIDFFFFCFNSLSVSKDIL